MDKHQMATLPSIHNHRLSRPGRLAAVALAGLALIGAGGASASSAHAGLGIPQKPTAAATLQASANATDLPPGPNAVDLPPGPNAQAEIIAI